MEPKHGTVRLDAAAEWLSKTTGRTFTADDLIDAHNKLPIYALIPKSLARPEYSAVVCHAVQKKAVEVAEAADRMAKKAPLKQVDVVELATETLPEDAALRYKWEKTAHEEGVYLLSARDLELLDIHGVQQLHRGVSIFNRWIGRPIQFGNPVDVTPDMLAVRRSQLVKFAELVAVEQPEARPDAQAQAAPAEHHKPRGRKPSDAPALLKQILDALDNYAAATGQDFDRNAMPGPLGESFDDEGSFHWLCASLYPYFKKAKPTFQKHRAGLCALAPYAKPTDFYRLALPHIAPKLGVTLNVHHMPEQGRKTA